MALFIPPKVARELVAERHEFESRLLGMAHVGGVLEEWNRELRQIDPYLQMVKAQDQLTPGTPLKPSHYHVVRHNPGAPPTVITIEGPDGEFIEPDSGVLRKLREELDLQNPLVARDRKRRQKALEEAEARREAQERAERQEEIRDRVLAATRAQVSLTDVPWSQNVRGRRR